MVKPIFEKNSTEKKEKTNIAPLQFPDKPIEVPISAPSPAPLFNKQEKDNSTLVNKACKRIAALNQSLYEDNSAYCQSQCSLLLPLNTTVIIDWGNKHLERMRITTNEVTRNVKIVIDTQCNEHVEDISKKLTSKPNWVVGLFKSKTEWIIKSESHLKTISSTLMTVLPVLDKLSNDMNMHNSKLTVKLAIISAVSDIVGVINDKIIESALHSRKVIIQQAVIQSQLSIQELVSTKKYIITQKQQIDHIINVSIPMFNSSRNSRE